MENKTDQRIIDVLKGLMDKPKKPRMPNLLIVGEQNCGKAELIDKFMDLHGRGYINKNHEQAKSVVLAKLPPKATEKELYKSVLGSFYEASKSNNERSAIELRQDVLYTLRHSEAKMLIIENFEAILAGTKMKQQVIMNAIKLIGNTLEIPIVGVGSVESIQVLEIDSQYASRFEVLSLL